jgi:signal transduction histidine kinase/CheY-like chemotaxis protein
MGSADAFPFRTFPVTFRFAVATAAVLIVYVLDAQSGPLIDDGSEFLLLTMAVMASAWFAGTGPAIFATVVGALVGVFEVGAESTPAAHMHLALFVVDGLLLTALASELRRARRVAEQRAREADRSRQESDSASRMKDEFLATISHELRTPLNAVLGWAHLLRTGKLDSPTAARGLEVVERNVRLQAQLTGDLLDVSKALTGRLRIESVPTSLTDAAREAVDAVLPAARAKGVELASDFPDVPVAVLGDEMRLRQIVWHLLTNAIKFTPRGGRASLRVQTTGDHASVTVFDSGPGIDPDFLPRIFDRFTQEDPSTTRAAGGLGVGLCLVRELVHLHAGEIVARSAPGEGSVFTASFPRLSDELLRRSPADSAHVAPVPPSLEGLRVLVLDQDRDAREAMQAVLRQRGAAVRTTDSVDEALEALEEWRPDVLVSDRATPDRDSYALVGKVQSLEAERGGRIPALALTAFGRADQRGRDILGGTVRDLPKPLDPAALTDEIARLAGRERHGVPR